MIKHIRFFDFDGCLFFNLLPEEGKVKWEEIHGIPYPHKGWWSKPESLDIKMGIYPNLHVIDHKRSCKKDDNLPLTSYHLLTARLGKLEPQIRTILQSEELVFDKYHFTHDKVATVKKTLELPEYSNVERIFLYDDREKELGPFMSLKHELRNELDVIVYEVTNYGTFKELK